MMSRMFAATAPLTHTRSGIISGCVMPKNTAPLPDWEHVLSAAARLQGVLPDAVLVGGTAAAIHAGHRFSRDHVLPDLKWRFDVVLGQLETVAGWKTARVQTPAQILGSLDGIETGVRQLIRRQPLETMVISRAGRALTIPTPSEILRVKGALILRRNATRDYIDFAALGAHLGDEVGGAMGRFDRLYPQDNGESALQQLLAQLANPMPYDLEETRLADYKNLNPRWHDWGVVKSVCGDIAARIFDGVCAEGA